MEPPRRPGLPFGASNNVHRHYRPKSNHCMRNYMTFGAPKDSIPRATRLASTVIIGSGSLAVPEGLDDLPVSDAHEVHAAVVLGAGDPPADDGPLAIDVDVLDREFDGGVGGQSLPAGKAF